MPVTSPDDFFVVEEIRTHVRQMFEHYGEDMGYFEEYMRGVLEHPLQEALDCFRDLTRYLPSQPKGGQDVQQLQGMSGAAKSTPLEPALTGGKGEIYGKSENAGITQRYSSAKNEARSSGRRFYTKYLTKPRVRKK